MPLVARLVFVVIALFSPPAIGDPAPKPAAPAGADDASRTNQDEAMRLFGEGRASYDSGRYAEAIAAFTRAYALAPDPLLVFNIAQAHRKAGNCLAALTAYRSFLRLDPSSARVEEARLHERGLAIQCPPRAHDAAPAAAATQPSSPAGDAARSEPLRPPEVAAKIAPDRSWWRSRAPVVGLAGGMALGLGAAGLRWWNDGRYEEWRRTDQMLATTMAPSGGAARESLAVAQDHNDQYLRSIRGVDNAVLGLGIAAAVCVASSLILLLLD